MIIFYAINNITIVYMRKQNNQFKDFIKSHPDTNFKRYILKRAKRDPNIYNRVNKEAERLRIAARIVALRKRNKLTQTQLANRAQTSQSAIAQIEAGKRSPTADTLIKIAQATGVQLNVSFLRPAQALRKN